MSTVCAEETTCPVCGEPLKAYTSRVRLEDGRVLCAQCFYAEADPLLALQVQATDPIRSLGAGLFGGVGLDTKLVVQVLADLDGRVQALEGEKA